MLWFAKIWTMSANHGVQAISGHMFANGTTSRGNYHAGVFPVGGKTIKRGEAHTPLSRHLCTFTGFRVRASQSKRMPNVLLRDCIVFCYVFLLFPEWKN